MSDPSLLPTELWFQDLRDAIDEVCALGIQLLETHRTAGPDAEKTANRWQLEKRLALEKAALHRILKGAASIVDSVTALGPVLRDALAAEDSKTETDWRSAVTDHASLIHESLPGIESDFSEVRHCALDLLRWSSRSGRIEDSDLPDRYRASHAALISHAPDFDGLWESIEQEVEALDERTSGAPVVRNLISALARHRDLKIRMRGFLRSVIEPPFDLVFQETETFLADWKTYSEQERGPLATQLNDCCQLLLYNRPAFDEQVEKIEPKLVNGMEASLFLLTFDNDRFLFLVDEDPLFDQLVITLLRLIKSVEFDQARDSIVTTLYREFLQS